MNATGGQSPSTRRTTISIGSPRSLKVTNTGEAAVAVRDHNDRLGITEVAIAELHLRRPARQMSLDHAIVGGLPIVGEVHRIEQHDLRAVHRYATDELLIRPLPICHGQPIPSERPVQRGQGRPDPIGAMDEKAAGGASKVLTASLPAARVS
jgi:hypothetical protein